MPAEPVEGEFRLGLRSGIILCNAINKVQTGAVPKGMGEPLNKYGSLIEAIHVMTGSLFHLSPMKIIVDDRH
ncbi:hypothetical protein EV1_012531 [Malus domestica]